MSLPAVNNDVRVNVPAAAPNRPASAPFGDPRFGVMDYFSGDNCGNCFGRLGVIIHFGGAVVNGALTVVSLATNPIYAAANGFCTLIHLRGAQDAQAARSMAQIERAAADLRVNVQQQQAANAQQQAQNAQQQVQIAAQRDQIQRVEAAAGELARQNANLNQANADLNQNNDKLTALIENGEQTLKKRCEEFHVLERRSDAVQIKLEVTTEQLGAEQAKLEATTQSLQEVEQQIRENTRSLTQQTQLLGQQTERSIQTLDAITHVANGRFGNQPHITLPSPRSAQAAGRFDRPLSTIPNLHARV